VGSTLFSFLCIDYINGDRQAVILSGIQSILDSIPNLKQTLISLKEGAIQSNQDLRYGYPYTMASSRERVSVHTTNGVEIRYVIPASVDSLYRLDDYISDKGGDTYYIFGTIGPYRNIDATILIKNGIDSLPNANTYKASKNSIRITFQGGGKRRKYTKKARKTRRRSRKHRS
jgi:hypothetical protein